MRCNQKGSAFFGLGILLLAVSLVTAATVPFYRNWVEKKKAIEAFNILAAIRAEQERHYIRQGSYAQNLKNLDIKELPEYFEFGRIEPGDTGTLENSWKLTLTRTGKDTKFGSYTVTFNEGGFDPDRSSISSYESINPMRG